jgi:hypothetical protein
MTASCRAAIALVMSLAVCPALGCKPKEAAPSEPPPVAAPVAVDGHIDPAPYRAQIEATEALLYQEDAALGAAEWKDLSRALLELHNAIVFHDTSPAARETSRRLFFFSAQVDAESRPKHSADELAVMRGVWEKIREEQFTVVDWFRTAAR